MMKYCCTKFSEKATQLDPPAGGGFASIPSLIPNAQFEPDEDDKTWNINGCCGGQCFVVTEMAYCPYCGSSLEEFKRVVEP